MIPRSWFRKLLDRPPPRAPEGSRQAPARFRATLPEKR
jgi:hypothetical protein